ncbi:MAG: sigma 54-interacting transcriptional regulator [Sandaracinaceae bacterium]
MASHPIPLPTLTTGEPFAETLSALEAARRATGRGSRLVLLDGPDEVGLPWLVDRFAEGRLTLRGRARSDVPHAPLEQIVVGAVAAWREAGLTDPMPFEALTCVAGCHRFWFEHDGDLERSSNAWEKAAERRAGFYEAVRQLLDVLAARRAPPLVVVDELGALDDETARLLASLLGEDGLGRVSDISPGPLWLGVLPPPEARSAAVRRLLRCRATQVLQVPTPGPEEVAAYLARREVAKEVWERTGGLLERVDRLLSGGLPGPAAATPSVRLLSPPPAGPRCRPASAAPDAALAEAERLIARHALAAAAAVLERTRRAHPRALEVLAPLADLRWLLGERRAALELARIPAEAEPEQAAHRLRLGRLLRRSGELDEAEVHLAAARDLGRAAGAAPAALRAEAEMAEATLERTSYDLAAEQAEAVAQVSEAQGLLELGLEARNTLGKVRWAQHRLDDAEAIFTANRARAEQAGLVPPLHRALNNLGMIELTRGDLATARNLLTQGVDLARRHGAVKFQAVALENLGVIDRLEGRYGEAARHYHASARLMRLLGHRRMAGRVTTNLAELYVTLGHPNLAMQLLDDLIERGIDDLRPEVRAEIHTVRGEGLDLAGEPERAEVEFRAAYDIGVAIGYRRTVALTAHLLSDWSRRRGAISEARRWLERAGDLKEPRFAVRRALARARLATTSEERVHHSRDAVAMAKRAADPLLEADTLVVQAEAMLEAGRTAEARRALGAAEALEARFLDHIPEALQDGFRERPTGRALAALARRLGEGRTPEEEGREGRALCRLVGSSRPMAQVRAWVRRVAPVDATVLITGESGTGKELVAASLHELSRRAGGPFVRVNCGAIVDSLLASELFGHERGAFTGADQRRRGRFELADGGTLFLDEVGELSAATQSALLRVLQERTFERVGGTRTLEVDVRVVVATNRDLARMVDDGAFRADLYYRLSGLQLDLPPLRERGDDIRELARHLLERLRAEHGLEETPRLAPDAVGRLAAHGWPGNVRELENVLRSAVLLSGRTVLRAVDLNGSAASALPTAPCVDGAEPDGREAPDLEEMFFDAVSREGSLYELRKQLERATIARALSAAEGNITQAARLLGMKRPRVSQLVKAYGLKDERAVSEESDG